MDKKFSLMVFIMMAVILSAAVPVFAVPPTKGSYTQTVIDHGLGGTEFWTGDVIHLRDAFGECYLYGDPFPLGNSISSSYTAKLDLNTVHGGGRYIGHVVDTYTAGRVEGIILILDFTGFDVFLYTGPTFTCTLSGVDYTVTTGDMFFGLNYEGGKAVKHGTGELAGFTMRGTFTGTSILEVIVGDPNMLGMGLSYETGTYSW